MQASHDTMMIRIITHSAARRLERTVLVPVGATVQSILDDVLRQPLDDLDVRINGRSHSRLTALLPGDRLEVV